MKQYDTFVFDRFTWNPTESLVQLHYALEGAEGGVDFVETLRFPSFPENAATPTLRRALHALHLCGGVSYYKTCLPKEIVVRSGNLTQEQAMFWNDTYENGLGEFFYKNNIDFRGLINFPAVPGWRAERMDDELRSRPKPKVLVPVGGGKDSVVTVELLRKAGCDVTLFRMGSHPFITALAHEMKLPLITVERALSNELFKLNSAGALNGHIPITAYLSWVTIVTALLYGFDAVAMSNERSASEGNIDFHGKQINHQWSKSLAFERAFQGYLERYVTRDVAYFSPLRPLSELHIGKLFAEHPKYFAHTTSCNANWRIVKEKPTDRWCGTCPKCAFVFAIMAAFLDAKAVTTMFSGKNLYADESLLPRFRELLGLTGHKPFECVGTPEETKAAFLLAHQRGDMEDTAAMKMFLAEAMSSIKDPDAPIKECLTPSNEHAIPPAFQPLAQLD